MLNLLLRQPRAEYLSPDATAGADAAAVTVTRATLVSAKTAGLSAPRLAALALRRLGALILLQL